MLVEVPPNPLADLRLSADLVRLVADVDEFKGRWHALGTLAPERLSALRRVATIESVASSTRIEGAKLTDAEVDALLRGVDVTSFRSRDEQEVMGYAAAMQMLFTSWRDMPLSENLIKHLHQVLLQHSDKDERHRGEYKKVRNDVQAVAPDGRVIGVLLETSSPFDTPRLMTSLVAWTNSTLGAGAQHPLLVVGVFVLLFLAIHPFQDGNGRLARVLTTLLLLRTGYEYVQYSSLERVIEENKDGYYLALRHAQTNLRGADNRLHEWIEFFLRALVGQKDALAARVARDRLMNGLSEMQETLLRLAREHGRLTVRTAVAATEANRSTIKANLGKLADKGLLLLRGEKRGAYYELP